MLNVPYENSMAALKSVKETLSHEKEQAVAVQDFDTAMAIRDASDLVKRAIKKLTKEPSQP